MIEKKALKIDLNIGDIILGGRFKNKRMKVKEFGTSDIGQPMVNKLQLLSVRIEKLLPVSKQSRKTQDMNKEAMVEIAEAAYADEMEKLAGKKLDPKKMKKISQGFRKSRFFK